MYSQRNNNKKKKKKHQIKQPREFHFKFLYEKDSAWYKSLLVILS